MSAPEHFADSGTLYILADKVGMLDEFRKLFPDNSPGFDDFFKSGNYIIIAVVVGGETTYHLVETENFDEEQ